LANQNFRVKNGLEVGNIKIDAGSGIITATKFVGDGSSLTNLPSGGGGTSDFVRTSAGIHTLGNVGIGTTIITSGLNIAKPAIGDTSNYVIAYGTFNTRFWGGIGTFSTYQFDFTSDSLNNTYVAGRFQDSIIYELNSSSYQEPRKPFIAKFNSTGDIEWQISLDATNPEYARYSGACGICSASGNTIIVAVESYPADKTTYDPTVAGFTTSYNGDSTLSFIKFNSSGQIQWQTTTENISLPNVFGPGAPYPSESKVYLSTDLSGNIYVTGKNKGPSEFPLSGSQSATGGFSHSSFIIKLDSNGSVVWQKTINPTSSVSFGSTIFQPVNPKEIFVKGTNIYWVGYFYLNNVNNAATRVIKFTYGGTTLNQVLTEGLLYVDDSENIYFASNTDTTFGYDNASYGYVIEKYNSSMTAKIWSKRINANFMSTNSQSSRAFRGEIQSLGVDESNGDVYLVALNVNRGSKYPVGYEIYRLNSSGDFIWKRFLSGMGVNGDPFTSHKIEVNGSKLKFTTTIDTPYISKELNFLPRPYNPNLDWVEPYHTFTYSSLIVNLNKDGNCIGEYGPFVVEELLYDRNTFKSSFVGTVSGIVSTRPGILTEFTSLPGIGTIGISTLTFGNIGITTSHIETAILGFGNRPPNTLSLKGNEPYSLSVDGSVKANTLIVNNLEFGYGTHSKGTIAIGYSAGWSDQHYGSSIGNSVNNRNSYNTFIGAYASPAGNYPIADVSYSNFIGYRAGSYVNQSYNSNLVGSFAGYYMSSGEGNNFFGAYAGYLTGYGDRNTGFGHYAGMLSMQTYANTYIGNEAGAFGGSYGGFANIFLGNYAGSCANGYNWGADYNIFIGSSAGWCVGSGSNNIFIGSYSGYVNVDGFGNTFFGSYAGCSNQTGSYNQFFGYYSGSNNLVGCDNNFIGRCSGYYNTTGNCNNFIGYNAGYGNTTGNYNNFFGDCAGFCNTTGSYNVFFGPKAGQYNPSSFCNTFIGGGAGRSSVGTASSIVAVGNAAGYNAGGSKNIFIGAYSGYSVNSGNSSTYIGAFTGIDTGSYKIVIGQGGNRWGSPNDELFDSPSPQKDTQLAIGVRTDTNPSKYWLVGNENFNVGIGTTNPKVKLQISGVLGFDVYDKSDSPSGTNEGLKVGANILLGDSTTGKSLVPYGLTDFEGMNNVFIGVGAGSSATSTYANHFIGKYAGRYTTTGNANIFFGVFSGENNTTGRGNQFFGTSSGITNTTGEFNHFFGNDAGYYNTIGSENNFFGSVAGFYNTTGGCNSFFGYASGVYNQTGSYNLFLGSYTGFSTSASNKVIIGRGAGWALDEVFDSPNTDNDTQLAIGIRTSSDPANYWLVGDENFNVGIGTTNPTSKLTVGGDVKVGINTSHGIILTSPNGTAYRLVVDDSGNLSTTLA
jgi:Fe-S cluster biogenesis protein NfuA